MELKDIDTNLIVKLLRTMHQQKKTSIHISFPFTLYNIVLKKPSGKFIKLFPGHVQQEEHFMNHSTRSYLLF